MRIDCELHLIPDATTGRLERGGCATAAAFALEPAGVGAAPGAPEAAMPPTWSRRVCGAHLELAVLSCPDPTWANRPAGAVRVYVIRGPGPRRPR